MPVSTVNGVDLVGSAEIRDMLGGISRQRVNVITSAKNFPDPLATLKMGQVWRRVDVERWISQHRPGLAQDEPQTEKGPHPTER